MFQSAEFVNLEREFCFTDRCLLRPIGYIATMDAEGHNCVSLNA
jgi:hypothetical protein